MGSELTEGVIEAFNAYADAWSNTPPDHMEDDPNIGAAYSALKSAILSAIKAAVEAERERCRKIVKAKCCDSNLGDSNAGARLMSAVLHKIGEVIAAAIESGAAT